MVLDGEKAFILSGTRYVYPKIQTKDSTGQSTYDTKEDKTGVYLQVGVQVGLDDDMVLTLYPQVASLSSFQNINGALYPIINTVEEQATVRALKGEVIILGGLKQNVLNDSKDSVPFLGHLPLLGKLFSDDLKASSDQELVFFLYPEIVEDPQYPVEMRLTTRPASAPGQPES
jgi:general secretion pathway protein D